jgi:hypothetical protein
MAEQVDNNWVSKQGLLDTEDPIKSYHDVSTTKETIKELLAGGTPKWFSHPEDYKNMVKEQFAADKEQSDQMAAAYKLENQSLFEDKKARMVNPMSAKDFINKLRENGVKCFVISNPTNRQQAGLWAIPPARKDKARYVCFIQVPAMYEWSVVNVNAHGVADGEAYRGWRTVLMELIKKEILTETEAHAIFGTPNVSARSSVYFKSLWELRNKRTWAPEFTER